MLKLSYSIVLTTIISLLFNCCNEYSKKKIYHGVLSDNFNQELYETSVIIDENIDIINSEFKKKPFSKDTVFKINFTSDFITFSGYVTKSYNRSFYELKNPNSIDSSNTKFFSYNFHSDDKHIFINFSGDTIFLENNSSENDKPFKFIGILSDKNESTNIDFISRKLRSEWKKRPYIDYLEHYTEYPSNDFFENRLIDGISTPTNIPISYTSSFKNYIFNAYNNTELEEEKDAVKKAYLGEFENYIKNKIPFIINYHFDTLNVSGNRFQDVGLKRKDIGETYHYGNYGGTGDIYDLRFFYYDSINKKIVNAGFGYRYLFNGYRDNRKQLIQKGIYSFYADNWNETLQNSKFCKYLENEILKKIFDNKNLTIRFPKHKIWDNGSASIFTDSDLKNKFDTFFSEFKKNINQRDFSKFKSLYLNKSDVISINGGNVNFNMSHMELLHKFLGNKNLVFSDDGYGSGYYSVTNWDDQLSGWFNFQNGQWIFGGIFETTMFLD